MSKKGLHLISELMAPALSRVRWHAIMLVSFSALSCKEPFTPKINGEETGFLVVEGYINLGSNAVTNIKLSRTSKVAEVVRLIGEVDAIIHIEDENGNSYPVLHRRNGNYASSELSLSRENRFRLSILTQHGKQYYSQFEESFASPPIDSLVWRRIYDGVGIYVNTHDPEGNIHYYQWDYDEVWEITSSDFSFYRYHLGQMIPRTYEETIAMYKCWKYDDPKRLLIASTSDLTMDIIPMRKLIHIPVSSEKLSEKYSVEVRQHAITRQAFEYLQMMDKNTSQVGSWFDPQPSELTGNIYCTSTNEPVVGFVGASTTTNARIFILEEQVPDWNFQLTCRNVSNLLNHPDTLEKYFGDQGFIPTNVNLANRWAGVMIHCLDCRMRNGTNIRPDFW